MQWKISERGIARRVLKPELLVVLSAINENESLLKMRESETLIAWIFKCFAKSRQNIESHRWERWFIRALTSSSNIFLRCVYYVISINILLSRLVSKKSLKSSFTGGNCWNYSFKHQKCKYLPTINWPNFFYWEEKKTNSLKWCILLALSACDPLLVPILTSCCSEESLTWLNSVWLLSRKHCGPRIVRLWTVWNDFRDLAVETEA